MIDIKKNSKLRINWKISPYDYSREVEKNIVEKISKKYLLPKDNVKVIPNFIMINEDGKELSITKDIIANIQDTDFQIKLFQEYIKINKIEDYDFDMIRSIDADINAKINYDVYDKYKRYSLKWIKWSNFLSYGENNYFDFTQLKNLVLIQGVHPFQNQSGKTTFAIDLFHFLLFGRTTKTDVQSKIFNKYLTEATEVEVEGCIMIDGNDYVIKRTLTRPRLDKRTNKSKTTQKIEYYKIVGDKEEELSDYVEAESNNGESVIETNKIIKESIGNESDFDLIICATSDTLKDLISMKDTDRGKLLSRWIGLLPLEEKDILARGKYNEEIKPYLVSNKYDRETLSNEIDAYVIDSKHKKSQIEQLDKDLKLCEKEIEDYEGIKNEYLSSVQSIDDNIMKIDIVTLNKRITDIIELGKNKKIELKNIDDNIYKLKDIEYSIEEHDKLQKNISEENEKLIECRTEYKHIKNTLDSLVETGLCPTCGRKYSIEENNELSNKLKELKDNGLIIANNLKKLNEKNDKLKSDRDSFNEKNKLIVKKSAIEVNISHLTNEYLEKNNLLKDYKKNSDAIDKNNSLKIKINNTEISLKEKRGRKDILNREKNNIENIIKNNEQEIKNRRDTIEQINKEAILLKNWKIYLDMVGKNGICKMVLRKTLPIINANLSKMLNGVCDFNVEVRINDKNDIEFYMVKNGVYSDLSSGSGFELTCGALALRSVLSQISTIPRANFFVADEILVAVAQENMDNMHNLYNKIMEDYDFILNVTHDESIKDWFNMIVTVNKTEDGISSVSLNTK